MKNREKFFLLFWFLVLNMKVFAQSPPSIWTQHNDNSRDGANLQETILSPSNVNPNGFGKLFTFPVDDEVYAQPLYVPNVTITTGSYSGTVHNVLYVATTNNSVYAFDADTPGAPLWQTTLTPSGESVANSNNFNCYVYLATVSSIQCGTFQKNIGGDGNMGVIGTPVIDLVNKILFVVARTASAGQYVQRLHALNIQSGAELSGSPSLISPSPSITIPNTFDPSAQNQRSALGLANGKVYIAWAGQCDSGLYHGWVMAFNATPGAGFLQFSNWSITSPDATSVDQGAGIWQAGQGPAIDANGNIYYMTGNGPFPGNGRNTSNPIDYGDSFIKLGSNLNITDFSTDQNYAHLNSEDLDLGAGGPLLVPGCNLLVGGGKESYLYTLNPNNLGGYNSSGTNRGFYVNPSYYFQHPDIGLEKFYCWLNDNCFAGFTNKDGGDFCNISYLDTQTHHIHGSPVYWNGPNNNPLIYVWPENDYLRAYSVSNCQFNTSTQTITGYHDVPVFYISWPCVYVFGICIPVPLPVQNLVQSAYNVNVLMGNPAATSTMQDFPGMPGGDLSISANGNNVGTGILWANLPKADANEAVVSGQLMALNASPDSSGHLDQLWNSDDNSSDAVGNYAKFVAPTVANGKVYLPTFGTSNSSTGYGIQVYGLKTCCQSLQETFTGLTQTEGMAVFGNQVYVTDGPNQGKVVKIYSLSGGAPVKTIAPGPGGTAVECGGVAVDGFGDIYVSDSTNNQVEEFTSGGSPLPVIGAGKLGSAPRDVIVTTQNGIVSLFISTGNGVIFQYNSATPASGGFPSTANFTYTDNSGSVPTGMVVVNGTLYVANNGNGEIVSFPVGTSSSSPTIVISGLSSIGGMASDAAGNFYVTYPNGGNVQRYSSNWHLEQTCSGLGTDWELALDTTGNVYVAQTAGGVAVLQSCIAEPTPTFTPTPCCLGINEVFSGLTQTEGMAVFGNQVYVTDGPNQGKVVKIYSLSGGAPVKTIAPGPGGTAVECEGVAVDGLGDIYVADSTNNQVEEFTSGGSPLPVIGAGNLGSSPRDVIVTTQNGIVSLFISTGNGVIFQYNSATPASGGFPSAANVTYTLGSGSIPTGMTVANGNLYVAVGSSGGNGEIVSFPLGTSSSSPTVVEGSLLSIAGLASDPAGKFYVTYPNGGNVQRYNSNWQLEQTCSGLGTDWELALDSTGKIYVAQIGGGVTVLQNCTNEPVLTPTPTPCCSGINENFSGLTQTEGLAVSGNRVYVTDGPNQGKVVKIYSLSGGAPLNTIAPGPGGKAVECEGVAVDGFGDIYVADMTNNQVEEFTAGGASLPAVGAGQLGSGPRGVIVTTQNGIVSLFVSTGSGAVFQFVSNNPTTGNFTAEAEYIYAYSGSVPTGMVVVNGILYVATAVNGGQNGEIVSFPVGTSSSSPTIVVGSLPPIAGLASDAAGKFYVTYPNGGNVQRYSSSWQLEQTCSGLGTDWEVGLDTTGKIYVAQTAGGVTILQNCVAEPPTPTPCCQGVNATFTPLTQTEGLAVVGNLVYVTDGPNQQKVVKIFNTAGGPPVVGTLAPGPNGSAVECEGVAVDQFQDIYVADLTNNQVEEYGPFNGMSYPLLQTISLGGSLGTPRNVIVVTQGTTASLFVSTWYATYQYNSTNPAAGGYPTSPNFSYKGNSSSVMTGMAVVNGTLYVVDGGNGEVVAFPVGANSSSPMVILSGLSAPVGLAADAAGKFYLTYSTINGGTLQRFNSNWGLEQTCTGLGTPLWEDGVDSTGRVYVAQGGGGVTVLQNCVPQPTPTFTPGGSSMRPLRQTDLEGENSTTPTVTPTISPTFTITPSPTLEPRTFQVVAAPNVSRNGEPIQFGVALGQAAQLQLTLFSLTGEQVYQTTVQGNAGLNSIYWSLQNLSGNPVASGLYVYRVEASDGSTVFKHVGKAVVIR